MGRRRDYDEGYDDARFEVNYVHKRGEIRREIRHTISRRGTARITMAPLRRGEGVDGLGQEGEHGLEGAPGV